MKKIKKLTMFLAALMACGTMSVASGCMDLVMTGLMPQSSSETTEGGDSSVEEGTSEESSSEEEGSSEDDESSVEEVVTSYTVTFKDANGTVLQSTEVEEGETPVYAGVTPTKAATAQYSYTFNGWDKELSAVTEDTVYTATYTETVNTYTVTFKNADGSILQSSELAYGETPSYAATPEKAGDVQYNYTFNGWDKSLSAVTGDVTYIATYKQVKKTYTVTFKNDDGTVLQSVEVAYGETPEYTQTAPTKEATAEFTYTFTGFGNVAAVVGNATYVATYEKTVNKYTVTFKNADGTVLQSAKVEYGSLPVFVGVTPTKDSTAEYSYTFKGWDKAMIAVTEDAEFTATYTQTKNKYVVTFKNADGSVLQSSEVEYGATPVYEGTPTKAADMQYVYTFAGWTPEVKAVEGVATYVATYTQKANTYKVTVKFNNGEADEVIEGATYGMTVSELYANAPEKEGHTFEGWYIGDSKLAPSALITGETTIEARYTINKYTVKFLNWDGSELQSSEVEWGKTPVYEGTPTKEPTAQYSYIFDGWDEEIKPVTGDATYTATYKETTRTYTIKFVDEDGTVLQSFELTYGETPSYVGTPEKEATAQYSYTFNGWDNEISEVTGDATYTATYTATVRAYTVKFVDDDGTELDSQEVEYGATPEYKGETPTKEATAQYSYTFKGWDSEISTVTGDATYTATYTATVKKYAVTFENEDGTVLQSGEVEYGATPEFAGETPTKEATTQYAYTFAGWDKEISAVTGEVTYTATYIEVTRKYTITFANTLDNTVETLEVEYGKTPEYTAPATKTTTEAYSSTAHTFVAWDKAFETVTGEAMYTASYKAMSSTWNGVLPEVASGATEADLFTGEGTKENPYVIATATDLATLVALTQDMTNDAVFSNANTYYVVTADMDMTAAFWTPICKATDAAGNGYFGANFNGQGHTITINSVNTAAELGYNYGFFQGIQGGTIENLTLAGTIDLKQKYIGGFVYISGGATLKNITNALNVTNRLGGYGTILSGMLGTTTDSGTTTLEDCELTGSVVATAAQFVGGFIGVIASEANVNIIDCVNDATKVENPYMYTGGFIARADGNGTVTITNSTNNANVKARGEGISGFVALASGGVDLTITGCVNNGDISTTGTTNGKNLGGILGQATSTNDGVDVGVITITNCINNGDITGYTQIAGIAGGKGSHADIIIDNCTNNGNVTATTSMAGGILDHFYIAANATICEVTNCTNTGVITAGGVVATAETGDRNGTEKVGLIVGYTGIVVNETQYAELVKGNKFVCTVTWVDVDGTVLETDTGIMANTGVTAEYNGATPTKAEDAAGTYTFIGWDKEISEVTGSITYTAKYETKVKKYTVTFVNNVDDEVMTAEVEYGKMPEYDAVETKQSSQEAYSTTAYKFSKWDKAFEAVTGNITYTALYTRVSTWNGVLPEVASGATEADLFTGEGTKENPYVIATATDLATLVALTQDMTNDAVFSNANTYYVVTADMDMTAAFWTPICKATDAAGNGYFGANFNGQGHTITINSVNTAAELGYNYGFFQGIQGGTIENLTLAGTIDLKQKYIGGFVYISGGATLKNITNALNVTNRLGGYGTILSGMLGTTTDSGTTTLEDCELTGSVVATAAQFVGGFIGVIASEANVNIIDCVNDATKVENPYMYTGGFIARADGNGTVTITNSTNNANVKARGEGISGFVALASGGVDLTITGCVNNGDISTTGTTNGKNLGGILGQATSTNDGVDVGVITITNCINNGDITGYTQIAGIAGGKGSHADIIIDNCTNNGNVTATTSMAGGILDHFYIAANATICEVTNCTNTGVITAGGVVATAETGDRNGTEKVGLIVGYTGIVVNAQQYAELVKGNTY